MTAYRIDECLLGDGESWFRIYVQRMKRKWTWDRLLPRRVDAGLAWEPYMACAMLCGDASYWHAGGRTYEYCATWVAKLQADEARRSKPEQIIKSTELP